MPADVVVTDAVFGNASPLMEPTRAKAAAKLVPLLEQGVLPVITGFNGATADGRPTTLGTRRHRLLGLDSGGGARRRRIVDLDRRGWHHERRPAAGAGRAGAGRDHLRRGRRAGV